jgi:energy-coupling factor transporter transmembrane protein EcfT
VGAVPLLALALFSPGLRAEGVWGYACFALGLFTLAGLVVSALHRRWLWALVAVQGILLGLVLYETFSDAALYVGT